MRVYYISWREGGYRDYADDIDVFYRCVVEMPPEVEVMSPEELLSELEALFTLCRHFHQPLASDVDVCLRKARVAKGLVDEKCVRKRLKHIKWMEKRLESYRLDHI